MEKLRKTEEEDRRNSGGKKVMKEQVERKIKELEKRI